MKSLNSRGYGFVELCIAILILSLFAEMLAVARLVMARQTVALADQTYAQMKALQMMEELKALVNRNPAWGASVLDGYGDVDGPHANPVLTTDKVVDRSGGGDPGDPLSGNRQANGHWRYLRQIQVKPFANNPLARDVTIQIWKYASDTDPLVPGVLLTTLKAVVGAN